MKKKRWYQGLLLILCTLIGFSAFIMPTVTAETNNPLNIPAPPVTGPSINNFSHNGNYRNSYTPYSNVQVLTDGKQGETQSMWWKNKVDLSKEFTLNFYVYMAANNPNDAADGITFTLQNDPNKDKAIGSNGEGLGSYGAFPYYYYSSSASKRYYNDSAFIHNALSFEFDSFYNPIGSDHFVSPQDIKHTAFVKPNDISTYDQFSGFKGKVYVQINHNDVKEVDNLVTSKKNPQTSDWKPVTYRWKPDQSKDGSGTVIVNFNGTDANHTSSYHVDASQFSGGDFKWDKKVYWGMTGSTGDNSMTSAVAMTKIPGNSGVSKTAVNLTQIAKDGVKVTDDGKMIYSNDSDKVTYDSAKSPDDSSLSEDTLSKAFPYGANYTNKKGQLVPIYSSSLQDVNVGDILFFQASIFNYKETDNTGNTWTDVKVRDELPSQLKALTGDDVINRDLGDVPVMDSSNKPTSQGFKATLISNKPDTGQSSIQNVFKAWGGDFATPEKPVQSSIVDIFPNQDKPVETPSVYVENNMRDVTNNDTNFSNTLNDVNDNDQIAYHVNLKNFGNVTLNDAKYSFFVPSLKDPNNVSVKVDGQNFNGKIDTEKQNDGHSYRITLNLGNIAPNSANPKNLDISLQLGNNPDKTYTNTPSLTGSNANNRLYYGQPDTYNFFHGSLSVIPYSFDFGNGTMMSPGSSMLPRSTYIFNNGERQTIQNISNIPGLKYPAAIINDTRKPDKRTPYTISLSQSGTNDNGEIKNADVIGAKDSPFVLSYFDNGKVTSLVPGDPNRIIKIYDSDDNPNGKEISWNSNKGLKLTATDKPTGVDKQYGASLNWIVSSKNNP